jgi:CHAD domain-containing protein
MVADHLARSVPITYAASSKAEHGYALSADEAEKPAGAGTIDLDPNVSTADALQTIALSCLDHAASNERAVRAGGPEGIQQMRVGLRRLRAAISVFKHLLCGPETETIKTELKWLTEKLGPARDFDVLIEQRIRPMHRSGPITVELGALERDLEVRRDAGFEKAKAAVNSERYRELGLCVALWIANGEWSRSSEPLSVARRQRPAPEFAVEQLAKRTKKISQKIEDIEALDAQRRHKLRISVKKLRYACEFFAGLFDGRRRITQRKHFVKTLKNLQKSLGNLNDIEVHKRLATSIAHPRRRSRKQTAKARAMGFIAGREDRDLRRDGREDGRAIVGFA